MELREPGTRILNRAELLACPEPLRSTRRLALELCEVALGAVDARLSTRAALQALRAQGALAGAVTVLAFGKAACAMAQAALELLDVAQGIVIAPQVAELAPLRVFTGRHPLPATDAPEHAREVLSLARRLPADSEVLVLVSGGGSAMLELPAAGLGLDELAETTRLLLASGAEIGELNAVRSALSQVKGGRLARALGHTRVRNVILSDVVGSPLAIIASGPTVAPDPGAPAARDVLLRRGLLERVPPAVVRLLCVPAPMQAGYAHVTSVIAADNLTAQAAVLAHAHAQGIAAVRLSEPLTGEAREAGPRFLAQARARATLTIAGGETAVTVRGTGRGGRNRELALACLATPFEGTLASFGTDGIDGTSDAAGALADAESLRRGGAHDLSRCLDENDSGDFFARAHSAIVTGPTGTNVADVCLYVPASCMHLP